MTGPDLAELLAALSHEVTRTSQTWEDEMNECCDSMKMATMTMGHTGFGIGVRAGAPVWQPMPGVTAVTLSFCPFCGARWDKAGRIWVERGALPAPARAAPARG